MFISRIRVSSTAKTIPMQVNGILYKWYPYVQLDRERRKIPELFIDSVRFSNSYLSGIEGDYDGDQVTVKIIFTQEANEECETVIGKKSYFINSTGNNIRDVGKEALQTFFVLTKDPYGEYKELTKEEKDYFLSLKKDDFTFSNLVSWFGNTVDLRDGDKHKQAKHSKFNPCDTLTLSHEEFSIVKEKEPIKTTLGRFIFHKILVEGLHFEHIFNYMNKVFLAKDFKAFDATIANALKEDNISVDQMVEYINTRDWFGLQLHAVITSSFTPGVVKLPESVKELRKKLFDENAEALKNGDSRVMENIENTLIAATKKELAGDIGMDLYNSGARGSVNNHLKNILITRGAVKNPVTKEYDIIENSLMDGLAKKDIPTHSNMLISGAFPKAVGTQVSGYMSKELLSALQAEVLADKDTDCGTKKTINVTLTNGNYRDYLYRYIKEGQGYVMLNMDNKSKYVGKTVQMRTPMYCIGVGKEKHLCNRCAGDFYYKLGKTNIGLVSSKIATTLTQMNLQKFHENLVQTQPIDVDNLLI